MKKDENNLICFEILNFCNPFELELKGWYVGSIVSKWLQHQILVTLCHVFFNISVFFTSINEYSFAYIS
jgi:hypothetical protein